MSHTTEIQGWRFIHDGDPRGGIVNIIIKDFVCPPVEIPFDVLYEFVANYVMNKKIERLEQAGPDEIFDIFDEKAELQELNRKMYPPAIQIGNGSLDDNSVPIYTAPVRGCECHDGAFKVKDD